MLPRSVAFRIAAVAAIAVLAAAHPPESSVATLIAVVQRAVERQDSDGKLAGEIRKIRLVQRLDDHVIEELESEGAGPKSVAEMLDLRDLSADLPEPASLPDFPEPPLPMRAEQDGILRSAAANAINYSAGLPNFMCTEVVHRYEDMSGPESGNPKTCSR